MAVVVGVDLVRFAAVFRNFWANLVDFGEFDNSLALFPFLVVFPVFREVGRRLVVLPGIFG